MSDTPDRNDEVLAIFEAQIPAAPPLAVEEPFAAPAPAEVGAAVRALTVTAGGAPLALIGITVPSITPRAAGFVGYMARRARARRAAYLLLTAQRETLLVRTPRRDSDALEILRAYPSEHTILPNAGDPLLPAERAVLVDLALRVAADLATLHRDGHLDLIIPDADFFVGRLTRAVDVLKPAVKQALQTKLGMDPRFAQEIEGWATPQGIPADLRSPDFAEAVVRQAIYRLLGKIIFYQSLRRAIAGLPEMKLEGLDTSQVLPALNACFAEAHKIDYHAVFREDVVDRLPYPAAASAELAALIGDLNTRDFAHLPQDVVGAVFERLIPPEDRHALGQFFTPEPLVDLTAAFCIREANDVVLDATCGTGTFLIRSYDRKRTRLNLYDHSRQLAQLWGVDIAPFPAELATINLFRQQVGMPGNFPRILNDDFFNVVPGGRYRFPPLKAVSDLEGLGDPQGLPGETDEPIPQFDAIVGNFPYIGAARIEEREKGYLKRIARRLAEEWFRAWPAGFTFHSPSDEKEFRLALEQELDVAPFLEKAEPIISAFADLYVSLFWHTAAFLKPGGRMGIVTSNAWLDVGYGYALQRFFLDHFKIVAILESRCEPWFTQAAVNTVVTILERCDSAAERDANPARFVKIKKPLAELIPWDMRLDAMNRWLGLDKLVTRIEAVGLDGQAGRPDRPFTYEDADFRVRAVRQGELRSQVEAAGQTAKWGVYLRAPQVYFDLLAEAGDKLALLKDVAPPSRGSLTGINEFYHLDETRIAEWGIEPEFLFPLLKSPGDSDRILVDEAELKLKVFVCRLTTDELRARGKQNALRYIEWGEQQVFASGAQTGQTWPHGAEVKGRKPGWYALPEYRGRPAQLFFASAYGDRHLHKYSEKPLIADKRLYFLSPVEGVQDELVAAVMNCSLTALMTELAGRVSLGDGALELTVEDAADGLHIPDIRKFNATQQHEIQDTFKPLLARPIGSVREEIGKADRRKLDAAVLRALGLDPDRWLTAIYEGLATLVGERVGLGRQRGQTRGKSKPGRAASRVAEEVLNDLLPDGPQRFPDAFLSPAAKRGSFRELPLPAQPLRHAGHLWGKEELTTADGAVLHVANKFEARYVLYAQANGQPVARLPEKPIEVSRAVADYGKYLRDLRGQLQQAYFARTLDRGAAERFVAEAWRKLGLPDTTEDR
jgi:hypothetical protein